MTKTLVLALLVATLLLACNATDTEMERMAELFVQPAISVSADELFKQYTQDSAIAHREYGGRRVAVTGIVAEVQDDSDLEPLVKFEVCPTGSCFTELAAQFSEKHRSIVHDWSSGDQITVVCYIPTEEGLDWNSVVALRICQPYNE